MLTGFPAFLISTLIISGLSRLGVSEVTAFFVSMPVLMLAWYYVLGRLVEYWSARNLLIPHWPLAAGISSLIAAVNVDSEIFRAVAAAVCFPLMVYECVLYRRTSNRAPRIFWSLIPSEIGLMATWLALNVARFYTYEPESERIWTWHERLIRVQDVLAWIIGILAATVLAWTLFYFARWLIKHLFTKKPSAA